MSQANAETGFGAAWDEAVRDIPDQGVERDRSASAEELAALAGLLELPAIRSLRAVYRVRPASNGRYVLKGRIEATIEQACVVTLKPLVNEVKQDLDGVFWPPEQIGAPSSGAVDVDDEPDPEPIENGRLPIARMMFETLAAGIDPFPRAEDAVLDWKQPPDEDKPASPFAALAKLKK